MFSRICSGQIYTFARAASEEFCSKDVYHRHGDHLGSAAYVTDYAGDPVQFITYRPYGQLDVNQHTSYDERYKFTGKERDEETGYDYFGARYYGSVFPLWLSVDPLAAKSPDISPYAYCGWNPMVYVDPDGRFGEIVWDVANVVLDGTSLAQNIRDGNIGAAVVDGLCLLVDVGAAVLPIVPGGAGTVVKAARAANKVDNTVDAGRVAKKVGNVNPNTNATNTLRANNGVSKPHGGAQHNQAIDEYIQNLPQNAEDIRKNQVQVDVNGNRVGNNRPDVQYNYDGMHYNVEFDTKPSNGILHKQTIQHNDPSSSIILKTIEK